jgi:hypothetical protein
MTGNVTLLVDVWYFVRLKRTGNVFSIEVDGVEKATVTDADPTWSESYSVNKFYIGLSRFGCLNGYIDDFRVIKGVALADAVPTREHISPANTRTITCDTAVLWNGSSPKQFNDINVNVDITQAGAGGLDTGARAASTIYYRYLIGKADGTLSACYSTSAVSPTLPAGYTYYMLTGCETTDASKTFFLNGQMDKEIFFYTWVELWAGTCPAAFTWLDMSSWIPLRCNVAKILHGNSAGNVNTIAAWSKDGATITNYYHDYYSATVYNTMLISPERTFPMHGAQGLYHRAYDGVGTQASQHYKLLGYTMNI